MSTSQDDFRRCGSALETSYGLGEGESQYPSGLGPTTLLAGMPEFGSETTGLEVEVWEFKR